MSKIFKKYNKIVIEDNSEIAGFGSLIKSLAYEMNFKGKIITYNVKDNFIHCYGTQEDLLIKHGINFDSIFREMLKK